MADFTDEIRAILTEYNAKVSQTLKEELPKVAKEAAKQLKGSSPRLTGKYASGWRQKSEITNLTVESVVYNAKSPGLAHLLEFGHAKRGGGRTSPITHIAPVEEWVKEEAVKAIEEALR